MTETSWQKGIAEERCTPDGSHKAKRKGGRVWGQDRCTIQSHVASDLFPSSRPHLLINLSATISSMDSLIDDIVLII
jgi:hypothetical protein